MMSPRNACTRSPSEGLAAGLPIVPVSPVEQAREPELFLEVVHGVLGGEEMATGTDLIDDLGGERFGRHLDAAEQAFD